MQKKDEADFSDPEDRIEFEERMKREGRNDSFDSVPHEKTYSWVDKTLGFIADSLMVLCILIAIIIAGYMVYVWWGVIKNLGFLEFSISLVLFFITIPLAPVYIEINGDWEPAIFVGLGFVIIAFIYSAVQWCLNEIHPPT